VVAFEKSREIYIGTQRLHNECAVFQAELCSIGMAVDWIQNQPVKTSSYAIHVDSKAALLAIANKHSTHPIVVDIRRKTMEIKTVTSITFHWIKGHMAGRKREGRLPGENNSELQPHHLLRCNSSVQRETDTGRLLH
jgi:ribonuclease HI